MACAREKIDGCELLRLITQLIQACQIAGQCGRVTRNIDEPLGGHLCDGVQQAFFTSLARRVNDDDVGLFPAGGQPFGGLRGIGYSIMPMLVSLVGACGLRLLWIATIFQLPQFHTIQTIYWSYPISWAITFGVHVICFLWAMKKVKRQLLPEGAPAPVEVPPTLEEETVSE